MGNQPMIYHHISQLVEKDGYWYEMDDGQNYWNKDYLFEAYTEDEISTLPSTLVNAEGIATAYLATQQDYGCEVYTKNGVTYVFSHEGRVRNLIVDPVTPAESAYDRETAPFVMMKLTRRYHSIPVNFVTISEEYNVTQSGDKAVRDQFMKDNGYAVKTTLVDYGYTANCCLVNDAITFKPKTEEPATEAGKTEASTGEAGKTEAPTGEAGKTETPTGEEGKTEAPTGEEGKTEAPTGEEGKTEAPTGEEGKTEAPTGEADKTEAPATEAPKTEAPATEAPKTEAPATEAPKTEAPATVAPTTQEAAKKANPMKVSVKNKTLKLKKLKKKAQTVKAITVKNAQGKVSYKLTDVPDKVKKLVKINSKGVITFKNWKKAKKGTYSIEVEITAKGNSKYESVTVTKLVKIKVK